VEGLHNPNRQHRSNNRSRPHRGRLIQLESSMEVTDPIQDTSDESITESRIPSRPTLSGAELPGSGRVKNRSFMDSADLAILGISKQVSKSPAKQDFAHTLNRTKKRLQHSDVNDEEDELAGDSDYRPPKKLNTGPKRHQPAQSSSISTRGDLKPSLAAEHKPAPLEGESLLLSGVIWAPSHIYDASGSSRDDGHHESLVLRSHEESATRAVLTLHRAMSPAEDCPQHHWFKIRSYNIERVRTNYNKYIIKMTVPSSLYANLGKTVYLRFHSKEDTEKLSLWIRRYSNLTSEADPNDTLEKEFLKQSAEVKKRPAPKATLHADAEASRQPTRRAVDAPAAQSGRRLIDALGSSSAVGSGTYGYPLSEGELSEQNRPRRSVRTRRDLSSPAPVSLPDRWTEVHPDWDKNWRLPLSFHRTAVEKDDIARLDEGQCLNDNIIGFYLKFLQTQAEKQRPETSKRIYFHNSFFYSKLKPTAGRHANYDGVKTWTAKVDIFSYDYIVVPVNEHFHWWVAIICNPGKLDSAVAQKAADSPGPGDDIEEVLAMSSSGNAGAHSSPQDDRDVVLQDRRDVTVSDDKDGGYNLEDPYSLPDSADERNAKAAVSGKGGEAAVIVDDDAAPTTAKSAPQKGRKRGRKSMGAPPRKYDPADPRIITLDSLGASHSPVCSHLKQYLIAEFKDKKGKDIEYSHPTIGMRATNIPEQNNFCDCGVYLLKYVAEFLGDPDKFIQSILLREHREWDFDASKMRNDIRQLIFDLHDPYQREQEEAKRQKALAKRKRERSKSEGPVDGSGSSAPKSSAERAVSPQKVVDSVVDSAPPASRRTSPGADGRASPQATVVETAAHNKTAHPTTSPKEQQNGPSEAAQYDNRAFHVIDDEDSKPTASKPSLPQPVQSTARPSQQSQLLPSIEIADDEDVPAKLEQPPQSSSRQASLSVGTGSVEVSDDEIVPVQHPPGSKAPQEHRRNRPSPRAAMSADDFYRKGEAQPQADGKTKKSSKPASPAKEASKPSFPPPPRIIHQGLGQKSEKSPFFGMGWKRDEQAKRDEQPKGKRTYKGARNTSNSGTIDLTDD
jgi:sentrin-specific protease 7